MRQLTLGLLVLFISSGSFAQQTIKEKRYPLKYSIGLGLSFPTNVRKAGFDEAYSPNLHLLLSKNTSDKFSFYSGMMLNGIGVVKTTPFFKYESYYVGIPIMAQYEFTKNLFAQFGVQQNLAFLTRESTLNGDKSTGRQVDINKSNSPNITFINGGLKVRLGQALDFGIIYGYPLQKSQNFTTRVDTVNYHYTFKNNQLQFLFTYTAPDFDKPKTEVEVSKMLIKELKTGALLFMLPSQSAIQEKMAHMGREAEATETQKQINELCKQIIEVSRTAYSFSGIYFFQPDKLEQIKNHNYTNCFVNANLEIDTGISLSSETKIMVAHCYINESSVQNYIDKKQSNPISDFILIKDAEDFKVSSPFPYEINLKSQAKGTKDNAVDLMMELNKELNRYYNKVTQ